MKRFWVCCLMLWVCYGGHALALELIEESPVEILKGTKIPHPFLALTIAKEIIGRYAGFSDDAKSHTPELVRAGFHMPGFAEKGDLLWEFRHCDGLLAIGKPFMEGLAGVLWIHPRTAKTKWWWFEGREACEFDYPFRIDAIQYPFEKMDRLLFTHESSTGEVVQLREITYFSRGQPLLVRYEFADGRNAANPIDEIQQPKATYWEYQSPFLPERLETGNAGTTQDNVAVSTRDMAIECVRRRLHFENVTDLTGLSFEAKLVASHWNSDGFCELGDWLWDVRIFRQETEESMLSCPSVWAEILVHARSANTCCIIGPPHLLGMLAPQNDHTQGNFQQQLETHACFIRRP